MCAKFHTPLQMVLVRVIISYQNCDFSLKHLNYFVGLDEMGAQLNCENSIMGRSFKLGVRPNFGE